MANRRSPDGVINPADPASLTEKTPSSTARGRKAPVWTPPRPKVTPEARHALIAQAAYLRAERRGFAPGHETDDWLAAEAEIDSLLKAEQTPRQ